MSPAVLRERFGPIEDVVAVATAIFVGRHAALHFCITQAASLIPRARREAINPKLA